MKIRNTFILIAILAALILYVYRVEIIGVREKEAAIGLSKKVMPYDPGSVKVVRISTGDDTVVCIRENSGWKITEPIQTKGDESEITSLLENLTETSIERKFEEELPSLTPYGLDDPRISVQLSGNGFSSDTLFIGEKSPTKTFVYARRSGSPGVFLLPQVVLSQCEKDLFSLRDKTVLEVDREEIEKFTINGKHGSITCEKRDNNWYVLEPVEDTADEGSVSRVLSSVANGKAVGFETEKTSYLSIYGLNNPAVTVDVFTGAEMKKHTLYIGDRADKSIYAKDAARDPIFRVNNVFHEAVNQEVKNFRNKKVLEFNRSDVTSLEIKTTNETIVCEMDTASNWSVMKAPGPLKSSANASEIKKLLSSLASLRVEEFIDDSPEDLSPYGLDYPRLEIVVSGKGAELAHVLVGGVMDDKSYARSTSRDLVYLVRGKSINNLLVTYEDLLEEEYKDEGGASAY